MSNPIAKSRFVPANPTRRPTSRSEDGKQAGDANTSAPSTNLTSIVPKRTAFVKAVPPGSRILNTTSPARSSSSSALQEESPSGSEEKSTPSENEPSNLSESEQSTEKTQPVISTPWQRTDTKHQKKLNRLKEKRREASSQRLERKKAQTLPQKLKLNLGLSSDAKFPSNATEFDHSITLSPVSNQHGLSQKNKKPLVSLIPKRLIEKLQEATSIKANEPVVNDEIANTHAREAFGKSMASTLESLHKSDLYKDALTANEDLATLRPLVLESYLASLLKNPSARETIETRELTADAAVAIRWYGREGFQYVQPSLRQKPDPALVEVNVVAPPTTFANLVKACDKGFAKLPPLPLGTELFRGTNFFNADLKPGEVYTDPAFVSTSTSRAVAEQKFQGCFVLKFINIPQDDPGWRDISSLTGNPSEAEVLCLPGRTFRVLSRGEGAEPGEGTIDNPEIITLEPVFMG